MSCFPLKCVDLSFQMLLHNRPISLDNEMKLFTVSAQDGAFPNLLVLHTCHGQPVGRLWKAVDGNTAEKNLREPALRPFRCLVSG